MKRYMDFTMTLFAATFLTVPILVSFGWGARSWADSTATAANAAPARNMSSAQMTKLCDSVDLDGTWVPQYAIDEVKQETGRNDANTLASNDVDRLDITRYNCVLNVRDVKNNELWTFDLSGQLQNNVPTAMASRVSRLGGGSKYINEFFESLRIKTVPYLSKQKDHIDGLHLDIQAELPKTERSPFAVDIEFKYFLAFGSSSSVYSSPGYQSSGQLPSPVSMQKIYLSGHIYDAHNGYEPNLTVVGVHSTWIFGPMEKAFVWGANYMIGAISDFPIAVPVTDMFLQSTGESSLNGSDALVLNKVSGKLF